MAVVSLFGPRRKGGPPAPPSPPKPPGDPKYPWLTDQVGARGYTPLDGEAVSQLPREWADLSWRAAPKEDGKLKLIACETNAIGILRHDSRWKGTLAFDEMAKKLAFTRPPPWATYDPRVLTSAPPFDSDTDPARLADWLMRAHGIQLSPARLLTAAHVVSQDRSFHPVRDWLNFIADSKVWDGKERVEAFFHRYFGAEDSPYTTAISKCFLLALVARAMVPGCKADDCVILEGEQEAWKSSSVKNLVGGLWFAEATSEIGTKDAQLAMHGKWLLEMPEMSAMTKAQIETTKAFFSRASDYLRPPYASGMKDLLRSSIPIATTNATRYLVDRTGNRRYRPILCEVTGPIRRDQIAQDRAQIFAEATLMYRTGPADRGRWWLERSETKALAAPVTAEREVIDPWEAPISAWLHGVVGGKRRGEIGVTLEACLTDVIAIELGRQTTRDIQRVAGIMRSLGLADSRPRDRAAERAAKRDGVPYRRPRYFGWVTGSTPETRSTTSGEFLETDAKKN